MADSGTIEQFQGPFGTSYTIPLQKNICRLGISMSEDDFMSWNSTTEIGEDSQGRPCTIYKPGNFFFELRTQNEQSRVIQMGKTQIYEMEWPEDNISLYFPNGAPASTLVNCVYH